MRVVTWNMANRKGAWDYLFDVIQPDYALLQEAQVRRGRPGFTKGRPIAQGSIKYGERGRYAWGSVVWSRYELREVPLATHQGWVVAAQPAKRRAPLLVSIHVELDRAGRSIPMLHRIISDLTPTIEGTARLVLGGDLNADVAFDKKYGSRRHAIAFERIEDLGLWHCNRLIPPGRRQTFKGPEPVMDDHLFVSRRMMGEAVSCRVLAGDDVPSDHFPVVVELEP